MSKNNYINTASIVTTVTILAGITWFFAGRCGFSRAKSKDKIKTKSSDTSPDHSITKISDVIEIIGNEPQDTLVIFDIDGVLLRNAPIISYFFGSHYDSPKKELIIQKIVSKNVHFRKQHQLMNKLELQKLMEFLEKNDQIYSICLTHAGVGSCTLYPGGDSARTEDLRIEHLKPYSDYFSTQHKILCRGSDALELDVPLHKKNTKVLFKQGILFVGNENINFDKAEKGYVLIKFLEKINYSPKKIIFIDDIAKNISSVEAACKILGIEYVGVLHQRDYEPKFWTKKFLSNLSTFSKYGVMFNDDSEEESDEWISKDEISKEFTKCMENVDEVLNSLPEAHDNLAVAVSGDIEHNAEL